MRKIKNLCCQPNFLPCGFAYYFYSMDIHPSFPFKEDINANFCPNYFYETCRKLIFWETLAH